MLVIGDRWVFNKIKHLKSSIKDYEFIDLDNVNHKNFKFGRVNAECGQAAVEYVKKAVKLVKSKKIDCLVTAPISKQAINLAGHKYSGHTELLAAAFGKKKQELVMMLLNKYLKISLVTRHLALNKVSAALKPQEIY